jgi:hypothetical protein
VFAPTSRKLTTHPKPPEQNTKPKTKARASNPKTPKAFVMSEGCKKKMMLVDEDENCSSTPMMSPQACPAQACPGLSVFSLGKREMYRVIIIIIYFFLWYPSPGGIYWVAWGNKILSEMPARAGSSFFTTPRPLPRKFFTTEHALPPIHQKFSAAA